MGPLLLLELSSAAALAAPTISAIDPTSGPTAGQTAITITGTDFVAGLTVDFGGASATSIVLTGSTSIACLDPAHAAGAVLVTVTNPDTQFATIDFTYIAVVPVVPPVVPPPVVIPPVRPAPEPGVAQVLPASGAGGRAVQWEFERPSRRAGRAIVHRVSGQRLELRLGHVAARGQTESVIVAGQARIRQLPRVKWTVGRAQGTGGAHVRIARMPGGRRHADVVTDAALEAWLLLQI